MHPIIPIPYYRAFTFGTPTIPDIYWNCYSHEERIKKLCMEYGNIEHYLDAVTDKLNECISIVNSIEENLSSTIERMAEDGAFDDTIESVIESKGVGTTYDDLKNYGFMLGRARG